MFVALCNHAEFKLLDFSHLKLTLSGGMALTHFAAQQWHSITGCEVYEGYGLKETTPVVAVNNGHDNRIGTVGIPLPLTEIDIRNEDHQSMAIGEAGELCI